MTKTKAYLFVSKELSEESDCLLVFTNEAGLSVSQPTPCKFSQLQAMLDDCPLTIIIPDQISSIHQVSLPLLSKKKARLAIPYALEDFSAQEVNELHFAFDRTFYRNGQNLVLSCEKAWLKALVALLETHQIEPTHITIAWFALSENQCVLHNQTLLCRSEPLNGVISMTMWGMISNQFATAEEIDTIQFDKAIDTPKELSKNLTTAEQTWETWVSERLHQSPFISLNQGNFSTIKEQTSLKKSLWLIGGSFILWLTIWLTTSLLSIHHTNQKLKQVDARIAVLYKKFFPSAKQVISPRFRISQKLKSQGSGNESGLWHLLDRLSAPLQTSHVNAIQLTYQHQRINLKLMADNFRQLETFMAALKRESLQTKQLDANRNEDKVEATVEVWL